MIEINLICKLPPKSTMDRRYWTLLAVLGAFHFVRAQEPAQRAVQLQALTQADPPAITLQWVADAAAPGYAIHRKSLEGTSWGAPITVLPSSATSWTDRDVQAGKGYEYAVFKKGFDKVYRTVQAPGGARLAFTIRDQFNKGLCCSFGFGYYKVEGCGRTLAEGADFGAVDSTVFTLCSGNPVNLNIEILPDMFPHGTHWRLWNLDSGQEIANAGIKGQPIDARPSYGFIYAGIDVLMPDSRGAVLVLVDDHFWPALQTEIERLEADLQAEGWRVLLQFVNRSATVPETKAKIIATAQQTPDLTALLLLGHVPVPYSGDIYPDTHDEHRGAWAADVYYADLDGNWTDQTVSRSTAQFEYNHNRPGDGRFDQGAVPSKVELQMGRVDFYQMPAFAADERTLMRKYLDKNHRFRSGRMQVTPRALIDDNFGQAFAAPAASAWRNFAPLVGPGAVEATDYFTEGRQRSYLWAYGCGSGSHISAEGIGTTDAFAADSLQIIFSMLFGSQFGDWDNLNNFLRAPLAQGLTLTNMWSGNPVWTLHQMGLGATIGYCTQATQNSSDGVYLNGPQLVHVALMGDPTLRMHPFPAPQQLEIGVVNRQIRLQWKAGSAGNLGYHLYRRRGEDSWERLTTEPLDQLTFTDAQPPAGLLKYMVRAVRREITPSGSYLNLSPGAAAQVEYTTGLRIPDENKWQIWPNPSTGTFWVKGAGDSRNWRLLDLAGRAIACQISALGADWHYLNCRLQNGVYFLQTSLGTKKIIISGG